MHSMHYYKHLGCLNVLAFQELIEALFKLLNVVLENLVALYRLVFFVTKVLGMLALKVSNKRGEFSTTTVVF